MNQDIFKSVMVSIAPAMQNEGHRLFSEFRDEDKSHPRRKMLMKINIMLQEISKDRYRMLKYLLGRDIESTYDLNLLEGQTLLRCAYGETVDTNTGYPILDSEFKAMMLHFSRYIDPFGTVYMDPPWAFAAGGNRHPKYSVLKVKDMAQLNVYDLAADNSRLIMWATMPFLDQAIKLGQDWGFKYKTTAFVWSKLNKKTVKDGYKTTSIDNDENWFIGTGYHTRANTELALLFTKGRPKRLSASVRQLIVAPVGAHSAKPLETYDRIEALSPGNYLELFARTCRKSWTQLGNELEGDGLDIRDSLPALLAKVRSI